MGIMGVNGNNGNGAVVQSNVMNQNVVNAGQIQSTVLLLLSKAFKMNAKYMFDDPACGVRMGFSVERLGYPYNTTIPVITRYPEITDGFINLSGNTALLAGIFANNVSALKDPTAFMRAFEELEAFMVNNGYNEIIQYGVRVAKLQDANGNFRFSYELEPSLAIGFKNDMKF